MAFTSVSLPAPAGNGVGAWIDVSTFGALKTISVEGNGTRISPFVIIECSNESAPSSAFTLCQFVTPGEQTLEVACHWMRSRVTNYIGGGAPTVEVGGDDSGASFAQVAVPAGNGTGASIDVSSLGQFKTVQVLGAFRGNLTLEVSEDGGTTFVGVEGFSFQQPGFASAVIAADFFRVTRNGVPQVAPGTPEVWVAGANPVGGGGGGALDVQLDGVDVVNPATILNFQTPGMFVEDEGGGSAKVTGTLLPVSDDVPQPNNGETFAITAGEMTHVDSENITAGNSAHAQMPAASSVLNGTLMAVKLANSEFGEGDILGTIDFVPDGSDTIDSQGGTFTDLNFVLNGQSVLFVSNGVDNWDVVAVFGSELQPSFPDEQAFIFTATGGEGPDNIPIPLPTNMDPTVDYIVEITMGDNTDQLTFAVINRANDHINVESSAALSAGDELLIFIKAVTS
jgi:hypothetical protein